MDGTRAPLLRGGRLWIGWRGRQTALGGLTRAHVIVVGLEVISNGDKCLKDCEYLILWVFTISGQRRFRVDGEIVAAICGPGLTPL